MAKAKSEVTSPETAQADKPDELAQADAGAATAEGAAAVEQATAPRTVRARVLAFCALGAPDDVIDIDADQVALVGDVIDTDPAAVAYAESLKV